ncbi:DNA polymerase III subunit epsilon [Anaplasma bovis]|uniref:DNA polymerase III subunit epsilon n=1 Tax=Anaplasma bovis TaxID=186733 RepID=UPI002FF0FEF5
MKAREIVLDTETTGLDADGGDRIIEIGCVELVDFVATGKFFHRYIDPERSISAAATRIHGITSLMLKDMPKFFEIADEFLDFVQDSPLIIHNARFDIRFIEVEMEKMGKKGIISNEIIDTLEIARKKFPGMPASLDALCKRFNILTHDRKLHGALKDANLLARVYVELCGGLQRSLTFCSLSETGETNQSTFRPKVDLVPRIFPLTHEEEMEHNANVVEKLNNSLWKIYLEHYQDGVDSDEREATS